MKKQSNGKKDIGELGPAFEKEVEVPLTEEERQQASNGCAAALGKIAVEELAIETFAAPHRKRIKEMRVEVDRLQAEYNSGKGMRKVQVAEKMNYRADQVETYRVDGKKPVLLRDLTRKMKREERQEAFPSVGRVVPRGKPELKSLPPVEGKGADAGASPPAAS